MKNLSHKFFIVAVLFFGLFGCESKKEPSLNMDNYFAWCIVPFDSTNRTPTQRIEMLKELGFKSYAYDWRQKHLPEMKEEFTLAAQNDIDVMAVWMWIDVADSVGRLSPDNERIFGIMKETGIKTQLWIGISEAYFEGLTEDESMLKAMEMVEYLSERSAEIGCKIGLYNHGGWFGDLINQVTLIKTMPEQDLGIIFNFHHAHELLDEYPVIVEKMMPYLWAVNLNGMKADGPKILPIGAGDLETRMIRQLKEAGYKGPYGILGHVEEADVKIILQRNLEGVKRIM